MQRVQKEVEIAQWFSKTLMDSSVTRLDDLKTGAHLVQLVHSMNPGAFDLSRCDFLASTSYHYEKNFKLLQSVLPPSMMPQHFAIERLMEGEKQRDLFNFCAFVRTHYKAWASQLAATGGALPTHNTYVGDSVSVLLPGRVSSGGEPSSVLAAIEDVRAAQENYDPVQERARAKEKRKFRSRPPLSNTARRALAMLESTSMRSSSDATSIGVHSAFSMVQIASHAMQRQGAGPPSSPSAVAVRGADAVLPPQSLVENWARSVQTPTGGTSPISDDRHPSPRESSVETAVAVANNTSAGVAAPTAAAAAVESTSPLSTAAPVAVVAAKPTVSMQYFPVLRGLAVWDLVDDTARFLDVMSELQLSVIVDVEGEGMESTSIISFEELMLRKYGKPVAAAAPSAPSAVVAPPHASRGDGLTATASANTTALHGEVVEPSAPIVSDAWDEFDELMLRAG